MAFASPQDATEAYNTLCEYRKSRSRDVYAELYISDETQNQHLAPTTATSGVMVPPMTTSLQQGPMQYQNPIPLHISHTNNNVMPMIYHQRQQAPHSRAPMSVSNSPSLQSHRHPPLTPQQQQPQYPFFFSPYPPQMGMVALPVREYGPPGSPTTTKQGVQLEAAKAGPA